MLLSAFLAVFALQVTPVDSAAVYGALLERVRAEYPAFPVVLSEASDVECMPICGAVLRDPDRSANPPTPRLPRRSHPPELLDRLRSRGLVDATCEAVALRFGCKGYPRHLFVALGEIEPHPARGPRPVDGGVWVRVALLVPCTNDCPAPGSTDPYFPNGHGLWLLLEPGENGAWAVERTEPWFMI
ncbi:MAG TPA: hypothetical protein VHG91_17720 [Longimicrobium sp.]|nr:hypothetical protein [Longimicrobium sp.]